MVPGDRSLVGADLFSVVLRRTGSTRRVVEYPFEDRVVSCTDGFEILSSTFLGAAGAMSEAPSTVKT